MDFSRWNIQNCGSIIGFTKLSWHTNYPHMRNFVNCIKVVLITSICFHHAYTHHEQDIFFSSPDQQNPNNQLWKLSCEILCLKWQSHRVPHLRALRTKWSKENPFLRKTPFLLRRDLQSFVSFSIVFSDTTCNFKLHLALSLKY